MTNDLSLADQAQMDRDDAFVRNAMGLPFGGLYDTGRAVVVPFIDYAGNLAVAAYDRLNHYGRTCTACAVGARTDGGPCEDECGRPATWRVRIGHQTELSCGGCTPDLLRSTARSFVAE